MDHDVVVLAKGRCGQIHDLEIFFDHLHMRQFVEPYRLRIRCRVAVVHTVNILGEQNHVCFDLRRPERCRCICREERIAGARTEDHDVAVFQMTQRSAPCIRLRDLFHFDCRLYLRRNPECQKRVLQRQGIHDRRQHAHIVCRSPVHVLARTSAPEVAAPDDNGDLHAQLVDLLDLLGDLARHFFTDAKMVTARKRLTADLEQHSFINRFHPYLPQT